MLSGAPISSIPISAGGSSDLSGAELFTFTLVVNQVVNFTLKLTT